MNKIVKYILPILIAVGLILVIKPFYDDYKEKQKYDFTVNTIDGQITKDSFKGKVLALYFGYMFCPDVCPTSLSSLAQALNTFPKETVDNFAGVFISVDPNRDTLQNLKEYSEYFHPKFIGATSTKENIDDIVKRYGSHYKKIPLENSAMGYSVSHTAFIYLFDKDGKLVAKIDHFSDPEKIKESLTKAFK